MDSTYSLEVQATDLKDFNAYQVDLTIVDDVPDGVQVEFTIETEIVNSLGVALTNLEFNLDLAPKSPPEIQPAIPETAATAVNTAAVTTVIAAAVG